MRHRALILALPLLGALPGRPAMAGDLGTAGYLHSIGGAACDGSGTDEAACHLPALDPAASPPQQAAQQIARARRYFDLLRTEDAQSALDRAVALDPRNVEALLLRGRYALWDGRGREATSDINTALKLAPDDADVLATKALIERDATVAQALADATRAVALAPDNPDVRTVRSMIYAGQGRSDLAVADLSFALAKHPDNDDIRGLRVQDLLQVKNYPAAVHDATILIDHNESNLVARQVRAEANVALGEDAEALKDLDWLVGPSPMAASRRATPAFQADIVRRAGVLARISHHGDAKAAMDAMLDAGGLRAVLHMQIFLHANGYPNVVINGKRSDTFDTALAACFADRTCGPRIHP